MNIMVRLKNIKIGDKFAEADFYPENSPTCGHIVVDLASEEIDSYSGVPGYGASYLAHSRQGLVRLAKEKSSQTEYLMMWY